MGDTAMLTVGTLLSTRWRPSPPLHPGVQCEWVLRPPPRVLS